MLSVGLVFILIAGISFIGFTINALFGKLKITSVVPLLLIGVLIGPVLHLLNVAQQDTINQLAPYISAVAISFVLFDVGMNIEFGSLSKVITRATLFILITQAVTGVFIAAAAYFLFRMDLLYALIFGFAASGPSSIVVSTFLKDLPLSKDIKTSLIYEGVLSDVIQLIVPIVLIGFILNNTQTLSAAAIGQSIFTEVFGAILLGAASAFFWLYILKKFKRASESYSWILTITMIIATYGVAQQLGMIGAISVFVFGILFASIGLVNESDVANLKKGIKNAETGVMETLNRYFSNVGNVAHTISYQREIVFFVSTFFFVYLGLLFSLSGISILEVGTAVAITILILIVRWPASRILKSYSKEKDPNKMEHSFVYYNIPRGLSPVIIATLLISDGIAVTGFANLMFMVILLTNLAFSIGIGLGYDQKHMLPEDPKV